MSDTRSPKVTSDGNEEGSPGTRHGGEDPEARQVPRTHAQHPLAALCRALPMHSSSLGSPLSLEAEHC